MNVDLWQEIDTYFNSGDIAGAVSHLEKLLRSSKADRFVALADLHFTTPLQAVLDHINAFITVCKSHFDIRSVYLEMNGFDINYDRWFFDSFAYDNYSDDHDDLDWLSEWNSPQWGSLTLQGLEQTQDDFRWYMENRIWKQESHESEKEIAILLVMVRFVALIRSALNVGPLAKPIPVLATAHDFDIIGRLTP